MNSKQCTFKLITATCLLSFLAITSHGEILSQKMKGIYYNLNDPVYIDLKENLPGTTLSMYGQNKNIYIIYYNINDEAIYAIIPPCKKTFRLTIVTEFKGFRSFCNGEEVEYYKSEDTIARYANITGSGLIKVIVARNEPRWAFKSEEDNIVIKDFQPIGIDPPVMYNMSDMNIDKIRVGDYIIFTGERRRNTDAVSVRLGGPYFGPAPLQLSLKPTSSPYLKVRAMEKDLVIEEETMERKLFDIADNARFTVSLVCEHLGWKIYYNGEEVYYYYHRFHRNFAKNIIFFGADINSTQSPDWKLLKLIWRHM